MNLEIASQYANELTELLKPYCERIEVAGGVRRKKPEPHDIELVAIPKIHTTALDGGFGYGNFEFGNALDYRIKNLVEFSAFQHGDADKAGKKAPFGKKYYRLKYRSEKLDIFAVLPPAQWGVIFTIRTGDAEFSHWLVQQGWKRGIYVEDGCLVKRKNSDFLRVNIERLETPEEADMFRILEVPYIEPEKRIGVPKKAVAPSS